MAETRSKIDSSVWSLGPEAKPIEHKMDIEGLEKARVLDEWATHPGREFNGPRINVGEMVAKADRRDPSAKKQAEDGLETLRARQKAAARSFLTGGDPVQFTAPSHGKVWNRDYNPQPYPEAVPLEQDIYVGSAVGFLYGFFGESGQAGWDHAWQLAGWNLVRTGGEVRARRRPK